jgi:hypothetical protein
VSWCVVVEAEELLSVLSEMMTCSNKFLQLVVNICVDVMLYCNELVQNCAVDVEKHLQDRCML